MSLLRNSRIWFEPTNTWLANFNLLFPHDRISISKQEWNYGAAPLLRVNA